MSLLRRHRDESSDREAPVSPAVTGIRPTQQYALVDGTWYESARIFDDGRYPASGEIALYAPSGRRFTVAASAVATMQMVRAEARYRGYWFQIGSLWSTPASPGLPDVNRGRIRGAVPSGARDVFAAMLYRGPDGVAVAELPARNRGISGRCRTTR